MRYVPWRATATAALVILASLIVASPARAESAPARAESAKSSSTVPVEVQKDLASALARAGEQGKPQAKAMAPGLGSALTERESAAAVARVVCYAAHVQNIGWQSSVCDGAIAGTTGQSLQMEAIAIAVSSSVGNVCYSAHVQNVGWQSAVCNGATAGTTGQGLRMEAIAIAVSVPSICYRAHVQDIGWQSAVCDSAVAGTTGQSLRMEAIAIAV